MIKILFILVLLPFSVLAKDYFGFSFEKDSIQTSQAKLNTYWIDHQTNNNTISFQKSGALRFFGHIESGEIVFSDKLEKIRIRSSLDEQNLKKLIDHLNDDYDFDQQKPLTLVELDNSKRVDVRGNIWQFTRKENFLLIEVSRTHDKITPM